MAATLWVNCMSRHKNFFTEALKATSRLLSVETRIERGGAQASVIFKSGLPFDIMHEYDDAKKPNLWSHLKAFQSVRFHLWLTDGRLGDITRLQEETNTLLFLLGGVNHVSTKLYNLAADSPQTPVMIRCFLNAIGRTSMGYGHELRTLESNELLGTLAVKVVCVDEKTRRPQAHPDWYINKYLPLVQEPETSLMKAHVENESCFRYKTTVLPSDIDNQDHLSYLSFLRYCSDCATVAFQCNAMKKFTGSFTQYKVKSVSLLYLSEANVNDELDIDIWEDGKQSDKLNFIISKAGEDIFHCSVQLHV
ncbi:uncharacterized protein [Ptychodera flava]|uniref:uncharacterized protein isoform X2 n=1 Tax=Ptychodera flava TaxID=63121 RepID=UPI00396A793E